MEWIRRLLGIKSPVERKRLKLTKLREKALKAERKGDIRLAGKYYHEAEFLETVIAEMAGRVAR